ncbi:MAG: DUF2782 domain-containing protein [Gammaproteobacteria bacterium]|nr:DUF2782 domain-containing protein [Gammaproteobacteria bacterium]MBU1647664.1 DUF2782 domain-containing protein [Gammaproteobacteria bacterium]MBU1971810.1 DUF2782 domain-containing protein [Gammaproteobacteria bacterium]
MRRRPLHFLLSALLLPVAFAALAQQRPADLQPLPEAPPPPPGLLDPALEPQVTIIKRGEDKVEEFRLSGKLYMIKVTPPGGKAYYLVDEKGDGLMTRRESFESGNRVPMWVIGNF